MHQEGLCHSKCSCHKKRHKKNFRPDIYIYYNDCGDCFLVLYALDHQMYTLTYTDFLKYNVTLLKWFLKGYSMVKGQSSQQMGERKLDIHVVKTQ
jgi:hypothetical protein